MATKGQIDVRVIVHINGMEKKHNPTQPSDLQDNSLSDSSLSSNSGTSKALVRASVAIKKPQQN